jgi:hypothetical protein
VGRSILNQALLSGSSLRPVILFLCFLWLASSAPAFTNGGFETGDTTGWVIDYGYGSAVSPTVNVLGPGFAPNTNNNLSRVDSGSWSCELYSGLGGAGTTFARISQSDIINGGNAILQFRYAGVLDGTHAGQGTPLLDSSVVVTVSDTAAVIYQATYRYASSPAPLVDDGVPPFKHLPWTTINVDLSAYIGTTVTVSFAAVDCLLGGHSSRAYVDGFSFVSPTATPTITPTFSISPTYTISPTITLTSTITPTPTITPTWSVSFTSTISPTLTATPSYSPTATMTATTTCSFTQTLSVTHSPTTTVTFTPTITPTLTPTPRPLLLKLLPPNPSPARDKSWLPYFLSTDADVDIEVWTMAGEPVRILHPGWRLAGYREDVWDLKNEAGNPVGSGIFIYRLRARSGRGETQQDFGKCAVAR